MLLLKGMVMKFSQLKCQTTLTLVFNNPRSIIIYELPSTEQPSWLMAIKLQTKQRCPRAPHTHLGPDRQRRQVTAGHPQGLWTAGFVS